MDKKVKNIPFIIIVFYTVLSSKITNKHVTVFKKKKNENISFSPKMIDIYFTKE